VNRFGPSFAQRQLEHAAALDELVPEDVFFRISVCNNKTTTTTIKTMERINKPCSTSCILPLSLQNEA